LWPPPNPPNPKTQNPNPQSPIPIKILLYFKNINLKKKLNE